MQAKLLPMPDCSRFRQEGCCYFCHEEGHVAEYRYDDHPKLLCQCFASTLRLMSWREDGKPGFVPAALHEERQALPFPDEPEWDP